MLPILLVPYADKIHSVALFWLRPSRQIRPPIYSLKQTKLRRRRVIRYSILYFVMLVVFLALLVGPVALRNPAVFNLDKTFNKNFRENTLMFLLQPTSPNNNDTKTEVTGSCVQGACPGPGGDGDSTGGAAASATDLRRMLAF